MMYNIVPEKQPSAASYAGGMGYAVSQLEQRVETQESQGAYANTPGMSKMDRFLLEQAAIAEKNKDLIAKEEKLAHDS